jgi:hypothetical protein
MAVEVVVLVTLRRNGDIPRLTVTVRTGGRAPLSSPVPPKWPDTPPATAAYAAAMHRTLADDLSRLPALLQSARDVAARELAGVDERPVARLDKAPDREPLPVEGTGGEAALTRFAERWAPGLSGSAGPRYLGFVTGGATPASVAGDWLTSAYDQNVSGAAGSWAAALERETVGWLRELFGLGEAHSGAFVTGATVSNTVGLAVAREWLGERLGVDVSREGPPRSARSTCSPAARTQASPRHCPCWASAGTGCGPCPYSPATEKLSTWTNSTLPSAS